jgi:hypothetical protein
VAAAVMTQDQIGLFRLVRTVLAKDRPNQGSDKLFAGGKIQL